MTILSEKLKLKRMDGNLLNQLSSSLEKHKKEIKLLNPLDIPIIYNHPKWKALDRKYYNRFKSYDKITISRNTIISEYKNWIHSKEGNYLNLFILTMMWGYDTPSYGGYRVNNMLNGENNLDHIKNSFDSILDRDIKNAYNELDKVKGLAISYTSKVLYFAGKAIGLKNYPLIFDIRAATGLVHLYSNGELTGLVKAGPINTYQAYSDYNVLLHTAAKKLKVEADQLEFFLFVKGKIEAK